MLVNSVKVKKASHSYLFIGENGIGKKQIAKEFAKMILCVDEEKKYCGKCKSCIEFSSNNNPDYMYINPDGNNIKISQIRQMQSKVQEKPIISNNKIYIIDNADLMTKEAQNCILKTLEEPPEFVTIILIATNENALLSTIKSRCMTIHFEKIKDKEMKEFLNKEYGIEEISQNMLDIFQGSITKAIELKDKSEKYENINKIIYNISKKDLIELVKNAEILYKSKEEILEILEYINTQLLQLSKENVNYANSINIVEDTKKRIKQNGNYDMCIDNMLFNIWEEVN